MAMTALMVDGRCVHVDDTGAPEAAALVFVNSLGTDLRIWDPVLPHLLPGLRVVRYDKPGHGLSETPPDGHRIDHHARDLAAVLDRLGIRGAAVCGLSVGGQIALTLATARPDLVTGLILCDTGHRLATPELWHQRIAAIEAGGLAAAAPAIIERWFAPGFRTTRPAEVALWRTLLSRTDRAGYVSACRAIAVADCTAAARAVAVPTLCLVGTEDLATPPDLVRALADLIPGAAYTEIHGAGHLPCIETPAALAGQITAFLKEHGLVRQS